MLAVKFWQETDTVRHIPSGRVAKILDFKSEAYEFWGGNPDVIKAYVSGDYPDIPFSSFADYWGLDEIEKVNHAT